MTSKRADWGSDRGGDLEQQQRVKRAEPDLQVEQAGSERRANLDPDAKRELTPPASAAAIRCGRRWKSAASLSLPSALEPRCVERAEVHLQGQRTLTKPLTNPAGVPHHVLLDARPSRRLVDRTPAAYSRQAVPLDAVCTGPEARARSRLVDHRQRLQARAPETTTAAPPGH